MKGSTDRVLECTTGTFEGCIAAVKPDRSFVVRLLAPSRSDVRRPNSSALVRRGGLIDSSRATDSFVPGVYAATTTGSLPAEDEERLLDRGWIPRGKDD